MKDRSGELKQGIEAFNREDFAKSMQLLLPLAKVGIIQAQCYVASMYQLGLGVPFDGKLAVKWYFLAAQKEDRYQKLSAVAYNNLGTIFSKGMPGISINTKLAKQYYRKAFELGFEMISKEWYE